VKPIIRTHDAERVAKAFHKTYERLAPRHGYETREASRVPWNKLPPENRKLMIETVRTLAEDGVIDLNPGRR
jgi:hypothetical protein